MNPSVNLINVTVDDFSPDPRTGLSIIYNNATWNTGQHCKKCVAQPDPAQAYQGSWHDNSYYPQDDEIATATFNFTGSAIYLYGIVKNSTYLWFFVDDMPHGTFTHSPSVVNAFEYHVLLFSVDSLPHEPHVFMVQNRDVNDHISLLLLDYLIYTTHGDTLATPTTSTSTAVITVTATSETSRAVLSLAIVFGTLLATIAVVEGVLWFCIHRRQKRRAGRTSTTFGPDTKANRGF